MKEWTCTKCGQRKSIEQFYKRSRSRPIQFVCKQCQSLYNQKWYKENRNRVQEKARRKGEKRRRETQQWLIDYFQTHPCIDCGNTDFRVLEFDHVKGQKEFNVVVALRSGKNIELVLNEIKKCKVRCANCHRVRHWRERNKAQ